MPERGPENETPVERVIRATRLPYAVGCLLFAIVFSPVGAIPFIYLDTLDFSKTINVVLSSESLQGNPNSLLYSAVYFLLFVLFFFTLLYSIRYLRKNVAEAETELSGLFSSGLEAFHRAFRHMSDKRVPLALFVLTVAQTPFFPVFSSIYAALTGDLSRGFLIIAFVWTDFGFTFFFWEFASVLWGLARLGKERIEFKPFYEDRLLGVGRLGSLSLSLSSVYFGVTLLLGLLLAVSPSPSYRGPATLAGAPVLIALGVALFFLPLYRIHQKMSEVKTRELSALRGGYAKFFAPAGDGTLTSRSSIDDLLLLEARERKVGSISTWPFNVSVIGRLAAIIVSVTAILISRYLTILLHLA